MVVWVGVHERGKLNVDVCVWACANGATYTRDFVVAPGGGERPTKVTAEAVERRTETNVTVSKQASE